MPNQSNVPAIQQLDFLPVHYHEEYARRRSRAWRILIVSLFAAALPTASLYQYRLRLSVERELTEIAQHHSQTAAVDAQLASVNAELVDSDAHAQLAAYLQHPWPASQLVAAIVRPLPTTIMLEEVSLHRRQETRQTLNIRSEEDEQDETIGPPAAEDLVNLKKEVDAGMVVHLTGLTTDSQQLHAYLAELARHRLIVQTELESIESEPARDGVVAAARFEATLVVQPGYGTANGMVGDDQVVHENRQDDSEENAS